jgi:hypothetical protein
MLTSENGIRESHSGQKYGRIDIPNRKSTKVCLTAPDGLPLEEILSGEDKQGNASPQRLMAPSDFIADGLAAAESRFALLDEGANGFLVVDRSGCPDQILRFLIH